MWRPYAQAVFDILILAGKHPFSDLQKNPQIFIEKSSFYAFIPKSGET